MSTENNCFFCGSECEIYTATLMHNVKDYTCKYCGHYLIDRFLMGRIPEINEKENKFKIACIMNERRLKNQSGVALSDKPDKDRKISNCPMISVSELLDEFPKRPSDFVDRALLNLDRLAEPTQPFRSIRLDLTTNKDYLHFFTPDKQGCYDFLHGLAEEGFIRFNIVAEGPQWDVFFLTPKFWKKVENLKKTDEIYDSSNDGNSLMEWDVFICHASEDKGDFVEPLAKALIEKGITVWYDRFELKLGDSLRGKIDEGLVNSRYGVVVLSKSFFNKDWPQKELDGLIALEVNNRKVILPIWHGIGIEEVRKFSPILASKLAAQSSDSIESIVLQIEDVLSIYPPISVDNAKSVQQDDLQFDQKLGIFSSKETGFSYCTRCYHLIPSKRVELQVKDNGWRCNACGKFYENPNYDPPEEDDDYLRT